MSCNRGGRESRGGAGERVDGRVVQKDVNEMYANYYLSEVSVIGRLPVCIFFHFYFLFCFLFLFELERHHNRSWIGRGDDWHEDILQRAGRLLARNWYVPSPSLLPLSSTPLFSLLHSVLV